MIWKEEGPLLYLSWLPMNLEEEVLTLEISGLKEPCDILLMAESELVLNFN
jgi:hypothetical protein